LTDLFEVQQDIARLFVNDLRAGGNDHNKVFSGFPGHVAVAALTAAFCLEMVFAAEG